MSLSRQQKRQIERKARAYIDAMDRDLIARIRIEKRGLMWFDANMVYLRRIDPTLEYVPHHERGLIA
jgi:hypothetical protein